MLRVRKSIVTALALLVLQGCASGVKREGPEAGASGTKGAPIAVSAVSISLSPEARKLVADNPKFDENRLAAAVRRAIEAKGLLKQDANAPKVELVVKEFRVKGTVSAIMLGALAGTDHVTGDVIVRDSAGKERRKFTVNATYGLGGYAGGQDEVRLGWLYDKFGELTALELAGEGGK